jgi:DNA-binding response OmpR family regulator
MQLGLVVKREGSYRPLSPLFATFVKRQPLPNILRAGPLRFDLRQHQVYVSDQAVDLSPSQYVALRLLTEQAGRLVSYEELAREIWPDEHYQESGRIKGLVSKLRNSLGPAGEHIENRRGLGYVLGLPSEQQVGVIASLA